MSTIYLLSKDSYARKDASRILLEKGGKLIGRLPLRSLSSLVVGPNANISTALLFACLQERIPVFFVDQSGRLLSQLVNDKLSLQRLQGQLSALSDKTHCLLLAKQIVLEKARNQYHLIKTYEKSITNPNLTKILSDIKILQKEIPFAASENELRGIEGSLAKTYFQIFPILLDQRTWKWQNRNRRPARDPVNALLNFGYAFLEREVRLALIAENVDLRMGIFHSSDGRKDSLVFDVMELFRQPVIDRFILNLLRRNTFKPKDFNEDEENGFRLNPKALFLWYERYERYMSTAYKEFDGRTPREQIQYRSSHLITEIFPS